MGKIKGKLSTKERMKRFKEKKTEEEWAQYREKDKLRKAQKLKDMTEEEQAIHRKKDKLRKAKKLMEMTKEEQAIHRKKRNLKEAKKLMEMTEEEKAIHRKKDKDRKARKRKEIKEKAQKEKEEEEEEERENQELLAEYYRDESRKRRSKMSDVKREYERIAQLIRNRKVRAERNGKEHLLDNLKAKKGMQKLKDKGRIEKYDQRFYYKRTELEIWRRYREIGPEYKEWLGVKNPDISKIFDEVDARQKKEKEDEEQKKKEEEEKQMKKKEEEKDKKKEDGNENEDDSYDSDGYWGVQDGDYYWYGKGKPLPIETLPSWEATEEEEKSMKEKKEKEYEQYFKELSEERKKEEQEREREKIIRRRECQKRYREKKRALWDKKVVMPEVGEKSAYQLLQEKNIEELEQRKKASGLFDDD